MAASFPSSNKPTLKTLEQEVMETVGILQIKLKLIIFWRWGYISGMEAWRKTV